MARANDTTFTMSPCPCAKHTPTPWVSLADPWSIISFMTIRRRGKWSMYALAFSNWQPQTFGRRRSFSFGEDRAPLQRTTHKYRASTHWHARLPLASHTTLGHQVASRAFILATNSQAVTKYLTAKCPQQLKTSIPTISQRRLHS